MNPEATAYHEAGHAVACWRLGYKPHHATIVPSGDAHGSVRHESPLRGINLNVDGSDRARLRIERAIIICLAGPLTQRKYNPRSWRRDHGRSDFDLTVKLALNVNGGGEQASAFIRWLELRTTAMIEINWKIISALAKALLEHKSMSAADIETVLANAARGLDRAHGAIRVLEDDTPLPPGHVWV